MFNTRALALAATAVLTFPSVAHAQYRQGLPETITPPPRHDRDNGGEAAAEFRAAYTRAGSPRAAVYWNRSLSDEPDTSYDSVTTLRTNSASGATREIQRGGRVLEDRAAASSEIELRSGRRRVEAEQSRRGLAERADWDVEAAFLARLQSAGIRLVDRAVAMRTRAAADAPDERRDVQTLEANALIDKSDLLIEVVQTPDPAAPFGFAFRASAKRIDTGEVLATVISTGQRAEAAPRPFVAGPAGFVRQSSPAQTPSEAGDVLAASLLRALSASWSN